MRNQGLNAEKITLRDPDGSLYQVDGRFIRAIHNHRAEEYRSILHSPTVTQLIDAKHCISFRELSDSSVAKIMSTQGYILEHPAVPFPSYPHEWSPAMLRATATLTLDIADAIAKDGLGLKDASPLNILFENAQPILVDALSFERRDERNPLWSPYSQFMENFVNPLIIHKLAGIAPHELFLTHPLGLKSSEALHYLGGLKRFHPLAFMNLTLPDFLGRRLADRPISSSTNVDPRQARFILRSLMRQLRRSLERTITTTSSHWTGYASNPESYEPSQAEDKRRWVESVFARIQPKRVLDVGCNTGDYSILAEKLGANVTSVDSDPAVIDRLWQRAQHERLRILPLVVSITQPSPAMGWRNRQARSFVSRCQSSPHDTVAMFALLHHLMVRELIPIEEIIALAGDLTTRHWIVELVLPNDRLYTKMARGRTIPLTAEEFESKFRDQFSLVEKHPITGTHRILYCLEKRS
ncbi:MAG: class I SAM-dependent methyltransferase [Deltaproteobacteria bacterium]|nr:class I SAM-dependent methyltransferase [Deltaproteobacteria bacterium]MBI3295848.1 class I SAM-dependent methyltransferase [Deltaproteobacteria bacterium]